MTKLSFLVTNLIGCVNIFFSHTSVTGKLYAKIESIAKNMINEIFFYIFFDRKVQLIRPELDVTRSDIFEKTRIRKATR